MNRGFGDMVVASPAIKHAASFGEAVDDDPDEKLIAKPSIEQLDIAVLSRVGVCDKQIFGVFFPGQRQINFDTKSMTL